jgi:hypothetical protein
VTGSRVAALRLVRSPRALVAAVGWTLLALVAAAVEHARAAPAAGHVLLGAFGAIALPLLVFAIAGAALGGQGLARASQPLVFFGANPLAVAAETLLVVVGVSLVACGLLSAIVAVVAHGPSDPPSLRDAFTSAWVGALAGAAYAAYFGFGAALFKNGAGRAMLLAIDWLIGGSGASALLTPRAHLRSLFGGTAPLALSQRASAAVLVALLVVYALLAVLLARRRS